MANPKVLIDGREFVPKLPPAINVDQTLAQYLQQLRELADLSVQDVADITGLRTWTIEAYERNAGTMHFSEAALLARCFGVSLDLFAARVTRYMADHEGVNAASGADEPPPNNERFLAHDGTAVPVGGQAERITSPQVMMNTLVQYEAPSALTLAQLEALEIDNDDEFDEDAEGGSEDGHIGVLVVDLL